MFREKDRRTQKKGSEYLNKNLNKKMNKKISTAFAIAVIIIVAGIFAFIFTKSDQDFGSGSGTYIQNKAGMKKVEKTDCSKRAYDGEIKVNGWYANEGGNWVLRISNNDLGKLPEEYEDSKVILADGSDNLIEKLKQSSEKNPSELIIKGVYFRCDGIPMVSVSPGEEVFKKYLTQK